MTSLYEVERTCVGVRGKLSAGMFVLLLALGLVVEPVNARTFMPPASDVPTQHRCGATGGPRLISILPKDSLPENSLPEYSLPEDSGGYATTLRSHPQLLVYQSSRETSREWMLSVTDLTEDKTLFEHIYTSEVTSHSFLSLSWPEAYPLQLGHRYEWHLIEILDGRMSPLSRVISGQIQRQVPSPALATSLEALEDIALLRALGNSSIGYDYAHLLATLKQSTTDDEGIENEERNSQIAHLWSELLLSASPVLRCHLNAPLQQL